MVNKSCGGLDKDYNELSNDKISRFLYQVKSSSPFFLILFLLKVDFYYYYK